MLLMPAAVDAAVGDISAQHAQTLSSIYAGVHVYSDTISTLGLYIRKWDGEEEGDIAPEHPLFTMLRDNFNDEQTTEQALAYMVSCYWLRGNSYAQIIRTNGGAVLGIQPLDPDCVTPRRDNKTNKIVYDVKVSPNGNQKEGTLEASDIIHVYINYHKPTLRGVSPIAFARQAITLGLSLDNYALKFFAGGTTARTVLTPPPGTTQDQAKQMLDGFNAFLETNNGTAVAPPGTTVTKLSLTPDECQFLQSRNFTVNECARFLTLPAYKIGGSRGSGYQYSNRADDTLELIAHSYRPVCRAFEAEFTRKLLLPSERGTVCIRFDLDELLEFTSAGIASKAETETDPEANMEPAEPANGQLEPLAGNMEVEEPMGPDNAGETKNAA